MPAPLPRTPFFPLLRSEYTGRFFDGQKRGPICPEADFLSMEARDVSKAHTAKLQEKLWEDFSKKLEEGLLDAENNVLTYNADVQAPFEGSWWQIGGYIAMIIMMSISVSLSVLLSCAVVTNNNVAK